MRTKQLYDKWISFEKFSLEECKELKERLEDIKSFIPYIGSVDKIKAFRDLRRMISMLDSQIDGTFEINKEYDNLLGLA